METTPFDLNQAIQQWRKDLEQSPAFQRENLNELETHLRDSVVRLHGSGLSDKEAFFISANRLGSGDELESQFARVNQKSVWRDRALWMMAGMVFMTVGMDLCTTVSSGLVLFGGSLSFDGFTAGWLGLAGGGVTFALLVICFWRLAKGRLGRLGSVISRLGHHPLLFAVVALFCVLILKVTPIVTQILYVRHVSPQNFGQAFVLANSFNVLSRLVLAALMVVVFARLWNRRVVHKSSRTAVVLSIGLAALMSLAPTHARAQEQPAKQSAAEKKEPATLDQAMTLWRAGKKDEAVAAFLAVNCSKRPLFPSGSVLNFPEIQFMKLPDAAREKMSQPMMDDLQVIKQICAHIRDAGESAAKSGDNAKAETYRAQLLKCGEAFDQPDSLALLKLVGKALKKMAAPVPKN